MAQRLIEEMLALNGERSKTFSLPGAESERRIYRAKHSEIAANMCMDGRLNFSVMTKTPFGIIQPHRNIGARFDIGSPFFGELMLNWVHYAEDRGKRCLIFNSYHFSAGDVHRGCAGFGYDTDAAAENAQRITHDFKEVFGTDHSSVYPIQVGIETDNDALLLHGRSGQVLNILEHLESGERELWEGVRELYPDMNTEVVSDLVHLLANNQEHVRDVQQRNRTPVELDHMEQILAIGRGFDWLHQPNRAIIVGPFSYDFSQPIATAATILLKNLTEGRIPSEQGILVMTSAVHRRPIGKEFEIAKRRARSWEAFAAQVIKENVPSLVPHLSFLKGTLNLDTRKFTALDSQ